MTGLSSSKKSTEIVGQEATVEHGGEIKRTGEVADQPQPRDLLVEPRAVELAVRPEIERDQLAQKLICQSLVDLPHLGVDLRRRIRLCNHEINRRAPGCDQLPDNVGMILDEARRRNA